MTKKGAKGTYHKPKPRLAIYAGAAGSIALAVGGSGSYRKSNVPNSLPESRRNQTLMADALENAVAIATKAEVGLAVVVPVVVGVVASVGADKLGINRALAKARMPFRI